MINRIFILYTLLSLSSLSNAQENNNYKFQQLIGEEYLDLSFTHNGIHLREGFLPGCIVLYSGDSLVNLQLRYNQYTDQVIWLSKTYGQVRLDKSVISQFTLISGDSILHFSKLRLAGSDSVAHFYQVCHEGKVRVLVQRKATHFTSYIRNKKHFQVYKPNPRYFLVIGQKIYHLNDPKIKSVYLLFPDLHESIQKRVRELNLKDRKETDFIYFLKQIEDILI